jgi:hypothetical protein
MSTRTRSHIPSLISVWTPDDAQANTLFTAMPCVDARHVSIRNSWNTQLLEASDVASIRGPMTTLALESLSSMCAIRVIDLSNRKECRL